MADENIIDVDLKTSGDFKEKLIGFLTHPFFISVIVIAVIFGGIIFAINKFKTPELPQAPAKEAATGQLESPKVTLDTYEDFVCPHCGEFNPILNELEKRYKDKPVKFVFHQYPFLSSYSFTAAEASEYANDKGKFSEYKDKIFEEQAKAYQEAGREDPTFASQDNLIKWAGEIGLDKDDLKKNLEGRTYKTRVSNEVDSAKSKGVNSTPTVFINNKEFVQDASKNQYLTVEGLAALIDAELAK